MSLPCDWPELWGGVECTVNRVGDRYHDQLLRSGHLGRLEDIERFASLGLRALRVPVLWERSSATCNAEPSFEWVAPMLERVASNGLRAVAGLVHHGSGPRDTNLLDPHFAPRLAQYAGQVARRFPELADYTPVNEPLTTARFSGLYGHWYPHGRDTRSFLLALLNECHATLLAMRAIREVRPDARLIQTEDIATVRSSEALAYQADYENHRRYLSFDLLCGRVDSCHPLYAHLRAHGIQDSQLAPFLDSPCPPDVLGLNYYFTSDRYLDEDLARYPAWTHGGNGRHAYADIDAGHAPGVGLMGHEAVLRAVWQRYKLPLAITEVHSGCTREEQLRWVNEAWQAATNLRREGIPVQAVTAWALLGSFDWNSLVCREDGVYETGVFDLRGHEPRRTALAKMVESLAKTGSYEHPVLESPGWWRRAAGFATQGDARPVLIAGGRGLLGRSVAQACEARGLSYVLPEREQLDITAPKAIERTLRLVRPWAVVNAAGMAQPELAERQPELCRRLNARGAEYLAEACRKHGVRLLTFSSDQVFDGQRDTPYVETDSVAPLSVYGHSQAEAERCVLEAHEDAFVVRTSSLFGSACERDPLTRALLALSSGLAVPMACPQTCSPTYLPHLAHACLDLLIDGAHGRWHLANVGEESWLGLLRRTAHSACVPHEQLSSECGAARAPRTPYRVLRSMHGSFMPSLEEALDHYLRDFSRVTRPSRAA